MEEFINKLVTMFVRVVMAEVLQPDNLRKIFDAWREANEPKLVEAGKPNENDTALETLISSSGMADVPLPVHLPR